MSQAWNIVLLVVGFGFVVFFHELGHFLAAKWAGVKVEQFAVGFGHAMLSWRKGMGFKLGTSGKQYEALAAEGKAAGIGETEYRVNWIPLGGYVKMLGQDDMKPGAEADDPRAFNRQSISKRMVIVSAGVIMNVILGAIGFMVLFRMGFNVPPATVGLVLPNSPAQKAGIQPGYDLLSIDGTPMHNDHTKIVLNVALAEAEKSVPVVVKRPDDAQKTLWVTPQRNSDGGKDFLALGIYPICDLIAAKRDPELQNLNKLVSPEVAALQPQDRITRVGNRPLKINEYHVLYQEIQNSGGKPLTIQVTSTEGKVRDIVIQPHFQQQIFGTHELNFGGMVPRVVVDGIDPKSPALGKLLPGDVVLAVSFKESADQLSMPTITELKKRLDMAGRKKMAFSLTVLRGKQEVTIPDLHAIKLGGGKHGLRISLMYDDKHPVIAGVLEGSPAERAGVTGNSMILRINNQVVENWYDVRSQLGTVEPGQQVTLVVHSLRNGERTLAMKLGAEQLAFIKGLTLASDIIEMGVLQDHIGLRKTTNVLEAAGWGATETRDFLLQFYLTLKRMVQGSVSPYNLMGPVGIFSAGTKFADRGYDWLLWFLAMISANLAVVNFLPIPVVDGGLFVFLILEKIQGKPLSQRAQAIAQYVGLSLILGVFLFVTYQDVVRLIS